MYNVTMNKDNADEYYYFNEDFFSSIFNDLRYNFLVFYAVYKGVIISMSIILFCNGQMHYHLSASNKEEFEKVYIRFLSKEINDKPIIFEVFTNHEDESKALEIITSLESSFKGKSKEIIKNLVGENNIRNIKRILKR